MNMSMSFHREHPSSRLRLVWLPSGYLHVSLWIGEDTAVDAAAQSKDCYVRHNTLHVHGTTFSLSNEERDAVAHFVSVDLEAVELSA